jgi:hypothetical protein
MTDALLCELRCAERTRRATRKAAIAALAAFALSRREEFERFLADDGEEPRAFVERWVETWAEAYRLRRAVIAQSGLAGWDRIATRRAYEHVVGLLKFVAEDLDSARDTGELEELLKQAGLYGRNTRQGYIDLSATAENGLRHELAAILRGLIDSGELPLNRRGAAGWRIGNDLWLIGKRTVGALKAHPWVSGLGDISPPDSTGVLDLLVNQGLVVAAPEGRPLWRATVTVGGQADFLSLLRFPIDRVWTRQDMVPPEESTATLDWSATDRIGLAERTSDQEGVNPAVPSIPVE